MIVDIGSRTSPFLHKIQVGPQGHCLQRIHQNPTMLLLLMRHRTLSSSLFYEVLSLKVLYCIYNIALIYRAYSLGIFSFLILFLLSTHGVGVDAMVDAP